VHRDRDPVVTRSYVEARATNDADDRVVDGMVNGSPAVTSIGW